MKNLLYIISCLILVGTLLADEKPYVKKGDKERIYAVSFDKLYSAALKTAAEGNVIEFNDEKNGVITYRSGKSFTSWGFRISITLTAVDQTHTRIKLVTQMVDKQIFAWGAGGRTVDKFFKNLDKILEGK